MSCRIICVGNRYVPGDDTGPRVFDRLAAAPLPAGVRLADGGLAGLNLLGLFEGEDRVVVVDAIAGGGSAGSVATLSRDQVAAGRYGHSGGLAYLLGVLSAVCEGPVPEVTLVGSEGVADDDTIARIAERALEIAACGREGSSHA